MKKFNNCRNVIGNLIKKHREEKHYTKADLSHKLEFENYDFISGYGLLIGR